MAFKEKKLEDLMKNPGKEIKNVVVEGIPSGISGLGFGGGLDNYFSFVLEGGLSCDSITKATHFAAKCLALLDHSRRKRQKVKIGGDYVGAYTMNVKYINFEELKLTLGLGDKEKIIYE